MWHKQFLGDRWSSELGTVTTIGMGRYGYIVVQLLDGQTYAVPFELGAKVAYLVDSGYVVQLWPTGLPTDAATGSQIITMIRDAIGEKNVGIG